MNRHAVKTATWIDATVGILKGLRGEAGRFSKCEFHTDDNVSAQTYTNVKNILDEAIDKINAEFEKL